MKLFNASLAAVAAVVAVAVPAAAQTADRVPSTRWVLGGGAFWQAAAPDFTDRAEFVAAGETGTIDTTFTPKSSGGFELSLGARVWGPFGLGAGLTFYGPAQDSAAGGTLVARVPHPFVANAHRTVTEPAQVKRKEVTIHTNLLYFIEATPRLRVVLGGGLSVVHADQSLVSRIEYYEDTAAAPTTVTVTGVAHASESGTGLGMNGSVDLIWAFNETVGMGAVVRYTRGTVSIDTGGRAVEVKTGGLQTGIGIRFLF